MTNVGFSVWGQQHNGHLGVAGLGEGLEGLAGCEPLQKWWNCRAGHSCWHATGGPTRRGLQQDCAGPTMIRGLCPDRSPAMTTSTGASTTSMFTVSICCRDLPLPMPQLGLTGCCCLAFLLGLFLDFPESSASLLGWAHTTSWFCSMQVIGLQKTGWPATDTCGILGGATASSCDMEPRGPKGRYPETREGDAGPNPLRGPSPDVQDSVILL